MSVSFLPKVIIPAVTDLTPEFLASRGIELLMLDFDNTIVPYTTSTPTEEMDRWLREMTASDIQLCVVSNSKNGRVQEFCRSYGIDCMIRARKPFPHGIRQCLQRYRVNAAEAALVGDQIFTDIIGANSCGLNTILLEPIKLEDGKSFKIRRKLEKRFIAKYERKAANER